MSHHEETDAEKLRELLADRLLTRRDQFAMAALTGILAGDAPGGDDRYGYASYPEDAALAAVALADATIAALDGDK